MMNKIKYIKALVFIFSAILLASCTEDIQKSDYDYVQDPTKLPTVIMEVGEVTGASVACDASISYNGDEEVIEKGFVCAKNIEFTEGVISKPVKTITYSGILIGLDELSDYFVKAYVITKNGIAYSDFEMITTPKFINPLLHLCGKYIESDYKYNGNELEGTYLVSFEPMPKNPVQLKLNNFWGGDTAVIVDVNLTTKKISIAPPQPIYIDKDYGDIFAFPIKNRSVDMSGNPVVGIINNDGSITLSAWAAAIEAGNFGLYSKSTFVPATNQLAGKYTETDYNYPADTIISTYADTVLIAPVAGDLGKIQISRLWKPGKSLAIYASVDFDGSVISIEKQLLYTDPVKGDLYICALNEDGTPDMSGSKNIIADIQEDGTIVLKNWAVASATETINAYTKTKLTLPDGSLPVKKKNLRLMK